MKVAKLIKTRDDYNQALSLAEDLLLKDPGTGTSEGDLLEVTALLIEDYERRNFPLDKLDPIAAIQLRMDEHGYKQKDLVPFLGSRSRVSEILSGTRPLTLPMIRALSAALNIPLNVLVAEPIKRNASEPLVPAVDIKQFPLPEMIKRGWLGSFAKKPDAHDIEVAVSQFLERAGGKQPAVALYRAGLSLSGVSNASMHSSFAWLARVSMRAKEEPLPAIYSPSSLSQEFFSSIAKLSRRKDGPLEAIRILRANGIAVVIEPALPRMQVDGAAFLIEKSKPVIGLTLRYDRIDSFWFTLLHELAHVWLHLNENGSAFLDNLSEGDSEERVEKEANRVARESFISSASWRRSLAYISPSSTGFLELAAKHEIHPAILAGRYQFETGNYRKFRNLLGQGEIRNLFRDVSFTL